MHKFFLSTVFVGCSLGFITGAVVANIQVPTVSGVAADGTVTIVNNSVKGGIGKSKVGVGVGIAVALVRTKVKDERTGKKLSKAEQMEFLYGTEDDVGQVRVAIIPYGGTVTLPNYMRNADQYDRVLWVVPANQLDDLDLALSKGQAGRIGHVRDIDAYALGSKGSLASIKVTLKDGSFKFGLIS